MYELIFTIMVVTKTGIPGFNIEHISRFQNLESCEKARSSMEEYMDKLVKEGRAFPGVFDCRKL
jgi:phage regulator Rha-like protein